ncbi:hypothetical protein KSP40_PGU014148 [Platanthera guangdongensis]|uniref:Uncharacterized protein n=1 Tax=Platanthera guangdongensis TaxID=2320717 RepID=A0ABR2MNM1_9ASPA
MNPPYASKVKVNPQLSFTKATAVANKYFVGEAKRKLVKDRAEDLERQLGLPERLLTKSSSGMDAQIADQMRVWINELEQKVEGLKA